MNIRASNCSENMMSEQATEATRALLWQEEEEEHRQQEVVRAGRGVEQQEEEEEKQGSLQRSTCH